MSQPFAITRRVRVAQTDFAQVMYFAEFFPLMEECLHECLRARGLSMDFTSTGLAWPRIEAACKYFRPFRYDEEVEIRATIAEVAEKVVSAEFTFHHAGADEVAAKGLLKIISCRPDPATGKLSSIPIPDEVRARLLAD